MQSRQGKLHFQVKGKRGKVRFVPVQVLAQRLIEKYLALAGHAANISTEGQYSSFTQDCSEVQQREIRWL
jgi:site-specific recombinase XerD